MSARVFVHPRCVEGVGLGALCANLEAHGYDVTRVFVGPEDKKGRRELVRAIEVLPDFGAVFERMDGTRFTHYAGRPAPAPTAA